MIFLCVIHSNFCMEKYIVKMYGNFLCVHYIVNFCMGKILVIFVCVHYIVIFVWENTNIFLYVIFCV